MKKINYVAITVAMLCFAGAVGATNIAQYDLIPTTEQLISYFAQAHKQDQAY